MRSHVNWIFCVLPLEIFISCLPFAFPLPNVLFSPSIDDANEMKLWCDRAIKYLIRTCTYKSVIASVNLLTCSIVHIQCSPLPCQTYHIHILLLNCCWTLLCIGKGYITTSTLLSNDIWIEAAPSYYNRFSSCCSPHIDKHKQTHIFVV